MMMAPTRKGTFVGVEAAAQASPLTLNFSGSLDLSGSGGAADTPFSGGFFVINDADFFGTGTNVDALVFATITEKNAILGDQLLLLAFSGLTSTWNTVSLPTDYGFLSEMKMRVSALSLEVPHEGDDNDILLGRGSFEVTRVPEPTTLTLSALGLAGLVARARRGRQRRGQ